MENDGISKQNPSIFRSLQYLYPHGHADFNQMCIGEMELHSRKNHDYARGGEPMGNFHRVANLLSMYPGLRLGDPAVVALVYAMKQVDATLWMLSNDYDGAVEGIASRLGDVSVYAKLAIILYKEEQEQREIDVIEAADELGNVPVVEEIDKEALGEGETPLSGKGFNEFDPEAYLQGKSYRHSHGEKTPMQGGELPCS